MKPITLNTIKSLNVSKDESVYYPTCRVSSPADDYYWLSLKVNPSVGHDFSYLPRVETDGKLPFKSLPKYPLIPKPYSVWRRVETLSHGSYIRKALEQECFFALKRTNYEKGQDWTWLDDVCQTLATPTLYRKKFEDTQHFIDPSPLRGHAILACSSHYRDIRFKGDKLASSVAARLYNRGDGDLDLLTELAEANKTLATLRDVFNSVATKKGLKNLATAVSRRNKRKAKSASNLILLGQYGLAPLYYAYKDAQQALRNLGRKKYRTKVSDTVLTKFGNHGYAFTHIRVNGTCFVEGLGRLRLKINPLLTLWELIPYSFVIDWVSNIGDVLGAIGAALNPLQTITGSVGIKLTTEVVYKGSESAPSDEVIYNVAKNPYSTGPREHRYMSRSVTFDSYHPAEYRMRSESFDRVVLSPQLVHLTFENNLSEWKAVIAAALIKQRTG